MTWSVFIVKSIGAKKEENSVRDLSSITLLYHNSCFVSEIEREKSATIILLDMISKERQEIIPGK